MAAILLFVTLFLLLSVPIGISLGLASLTAIQGSDCISMTTFVQSMIQGLNSFPLMAVPLFTFAGEVMGKGGISRRLIDLARVFTGRFTGGLGIVTIVTSLFFAAIAGTGSAAVAAIGLIMIPAMVKNGYDKGYSSALVATAGTVGVIIPPSVCMVVYAVAAGASISGLFMAGIMPGLLIGVGLIIYSVFYSKKHGYKGDDKRYTLAEAGAIVVKAIPGLLIPVIILGGIYGGIFTPTEAAAVAGVYGVLIGLFVYKEIKPGDLVYIVYRSVLMCAPVLIIIGISTGFGRILTIAQVPVAIADAILGLTSSKVLVLLLINVLLLIVGTFMETNAAIIILTPILLPIVTRLGVDYTLAEAGAIVVKAIPGLLIPVIILGGIYGGIFTPTEAAAVAGVYGVLIGLFVYKEIKPGDLVYIVYRSVLMCAPVLIIIGISTGFGRILTIAQVPVAIADAILGLTSSKVLVLLLINVLLLIVGTFMETNAAIIILTPILLPIVTRLGVDAVHFGIIVVMNLSIGFITPPLGANLFMACQVGEISFDKLTRKIWPWIVVMIILLMLVTYIPQISLALPKAMGVI